MASDPDDAAVVGSIIDLARALGLRVVAEGVEDDQTRRMLLAAGCEVAQGWFYARPMPADDLVAWLARYRPGRCPAVTRVAPPLGLSEVDARPDLRSSRRTTGVPGTSWRAPADSAVERGPARDPGEPDK